MHKASGRSLLALVQPERQWELVPSPPSSAFLRLLRAFCSASPGLEDGGGRLRSHRWKPGRCQARWEGPQAHPVSAGEDCGFESISLACPLPQEFTLKEGSFDGKDLKITALPQFDQCKSKFQMHPTCPLIQKQTNKQKNGGKKECTAAHETAFPVLVGFCHSWTPCPGAGSCVLLRGPSIARPHRCVDTRYLYANTPSWIKTWRFPSHWRLCLGHRLSLSSGGCSSKR